MPARSPNFEATPRQPPTSRSASRYPETCCFGPCTAKLRILRTHGAEFGINVVLNRLSAGLDAALLETRQAKPTGPPPWPRGAYWQLVHDLDQAANHTAVAGEILASHVSPTQPHRGRTPDGEALLSNPTATLHEIAQIGMAAGFLDTKLAAWLRPGPGTGQWLPTIHAAHTDAERYTGLYLLFSLLADHTDPGRHHSAPPAPLTLAPIVSDPTQWNQIDSPRRAVEAVTAARVWLTQNGKEVTAAQLRTASRAAAAITHHAGQLLTHTGSTDQTTGDVIAAAAAAWRGAAGTAEALRSTRGQPHGTDTMTTALTATEQWLRRTLRPRGQWLPAISWQPPHTATQWRRLAGQLAHQLSGLGTQLRRAAAAGCARGYLLGIAGETAHQGPLMRSAPTWIPATAYHPSYQAIKDRLQAAADMSGRLATIAEQAPLTASAHEPRHRSATRGAVAARPRSTSTARDAERG